MVLKGELKDKWEDFCIRNPDIVNATANSMIEYIDWAQKAKAAFANVKK